MTDRELFIKALDALEWNLPVIQDYGDKEQLNRQNNAITILRDRLQQTEQEPVAWMYVNEDGECEEIGYGGTYLAGFEECTPLYAAPPQRPWVGLTEREVELIDGMIEVELQHAERCERIANRNMAEKQKGWDMERVALLRKIKEKNT